MGIQAQPSSGCTWIPVVSADCPSDNGQSLPDCTNNMADGELCEADAALPDGTTNFDIDNCGPYDVFRFECDGMSSVSTCNVDIQRVSVTPGNNPCAGQNCDTGRFVAILWCQLCHRCWTWNVGCLCARKWTAKWHGSRQFRNERAAKRLRLHCLQNMCLEFQWQLLPHVR